MDSEEPEETNDGSVDMRRYVLILLRRWRLIVLVAFAATTVGVAAALIAPPPYEAVAGVVIVNTQSDIVFDPRFNTVAGGNISPDTVQSSDARRSALVGLVHNGAIASQVISQLGSQLEEDERNPAALMDQVKAELLQKGDLVLVRVRDEDPAKAAAIANTWAQEYERAVNGIYGGSPSDYDVSVRTELTRTRQAFDQAQTALEQFLATNRVEALRRQISDTQALANALADARVSSQTQAVALAAESQVKTLTELYTTQMRVRLLLEDARAMRDQVRAGGESAAASNGLALQLLKTQAFALSVRLPGQLQVQTGAGLPGTAVVAQAADLEGLIGALEKRDATVTFAIAAQSQILLSAQGGTAITATAMLTMPAASQTVATLQAQVRSMQSELEQVEANWQTLAHARDLSWSTYSTLAKKQAEVEVAAAKGGSKVRFASPAVPPVGRSSPRTTSVLMAGLLGLLLGGTAAFMVEYLPGGGPPRNRLLRWILG